MNKIIEKYYFAFCKMILSDLESNNQIVGKNTATIVLSQPNNLQMFYYVSDKSKFHIQHEDSILQ